MENNTKALTRCASSGPSTNRIAVPVPRGSTRVVTAPMVIAADNSPWPFGPSHRAITIPTTKADPAFSRANNREELIAFISPPARHGAPATGGDQTLRLTYPSTASESFARISAGFPMTTELSGTSRFT